MLIAARVAQVGRLLVFESGAVKLQMGDVLLDVAPGNPSAIRQVQCRILHIYLSLAFHCCGRSA